MVSKIRIHEVAPRDGLQNEAIVLGTAVKVDLIQKLLQASPDSIEVTSFVRPDKLPQLADALDLIPQLPNSSGTKYFALVPNRRGLERFLETPLKGATVLVSTTDEHSLANVGMPRLEALRETCSMIRDARKEGVAIRAYVSMAFGCPLGGAVEPEVVRDTVAAFSEAEAELVVLADTWGRGEPASVEALLEISRTQLQLERLGLHMHDTYGNALSNCQRGIEMGVTHFDASVGGCGGCPFAPEASGNLDTRSLCQLIESLGFEHSLQIDSLEESAHFLQQALGANLT
ncbi:MAG: hydroxymethylglutaryl-CoA lyase [Planctomycetota bacterium]|jgi:hydroxymethylglutaryl-CoA lyase|nr:hydroxymethylglutaryl-CoA lyase [Planctomycetota bacterium]MDP6940405.1 hydroxymethylglutaryl-CoA lyase [Planctomycetota bacterium]